MSINLYVPYIAETYDQYLMAKHCLDVALKNAVFDTTSVFLIDNGSPLKVEHDKVIQNDTNIGVLPTFKQGFMHNYADICGFIHSDVLLQEAGWDKKLANAFNSDYEIGVVGLFGAKGINTDGGRIEPVSNMQGIEWGDHGSAHGRVSNEIERVAVFDGVGMFFRKTLADQLLYESDALADWRAPHHFYDRILSVKSMDLGWKLAVAGIAFDHAGGQTANHSKIYEEFAINWLKSHNLYTKSARNPDLDIYYLAEEQFMREYGLRFPLIVS